MVLTIHHLRYLQSGRIAWLCEELGIDYELNTYERSPLLEPLAYEHCTLRNRHQPFRAVI
jgi:glutathione S-transferase